LAPSTPTFIGDLDLHSLVDGRLSSDRRAEIARRLAAAPAERARADSWQKQNEWLRTAFAAVEREPLPIALDLTARLRTSHLADLSQAPSTSERTRSQRSVGWGVAALLILAAGMLGWWIVVNLTDTPAAVRAPAASETAVAERAIVALNGAAARPSAEETAPIDAPDLRESGYNLVGARLVSGEAPTAVFRYRGSGAVRLALSVAPSATSETEAPPVRIGEAFVWRKAGRVFALAGTLPPARLHALATLLAEGQEPAADERTDQ
jgi:anti-sigma factor RsiW